MTNLAAALLDATLGSGTAAADAVVDSQRTLTRADLAAEVAGRRVALAVAPGERVAIVASNSADFVAEYLAVLAAGAVAAPLNPHAPDAELLRQIQTIDPCVVSVSAAFAARLQRADLGRARLRMIEERSSGPIVAAVERSDADLAVLLFTSGVAGAPKPAMLTHGSLHSNLEQVQTRAAMALTSADVVLGVLPAFHIFGLNAVIGLGLAAGATVVAVEQFDPAGVLELVRDRRITVVPGVPAMFAALAATASDTSAFASVRLAVAGAAALPVELAAAFHDRFAVTIYEGYGLTEASPIVTSAAVAAAIRPGSIGPPLPGQTIRLVDSDGTDVLAGDPGEILVAGPNVFAGYWNDPDATAAAIDADGWLHTGDIAVSDDDGWLTLVDRNKDLIIVSGFNVYPAEVEDALAEHASVRQAAVVGTPGDHGSENIVAFFEVEPGHDAPTPTQLIAHLRRRVARYKIPARFEMVDEWPLTFAGKVLRRELLSRLEAASSPAP